MRVLFTCQPALPHLYPMVPLAWAIRASGGEVRIASGSRIIEGLVATGLPALELLASPQWTQAGREEMQRAIWDQGPWPPDWGRNLLALHHDQRAYLELLGRSLIRGADAVADELAGHARRWRPDLIVYDAVSYAGAVVAALLSVPAVRFLFGTATVPHLELTATGEPLPEYVALFESRGLPVTAPVAEVEPTPP